MKWRRKGGRGRLEQGAKEVKRVEMRVYLQARKRPQRKGAARTPLYRLEPSWTTVYTVRYACAQLSEPNRKQGCVGCKGTLGAPLHSNQGPKKHKGTNARVLGEHHCARCSLHTPRVFTLGLPVTNSGIESQVPQGLGLILRIPNT